MTDSTEPSDVTHVLEAVEADVRQGLDDWLHGLEFSLVGPFADRGAVLDGPFAVVQWSYRGVDDRSGFNGMWPTGKSVRVSGITVIDREQEPWRFHRHVDWNGVNAQLGGSRGRSSSPLLVKHPEEAQYLAALCYGFTDDGRTRPDP